MNQKEYVFLEVIDRKGTSEKGQEYHIYKLKFADPLTFENHQLNMKVGTDVRGYSKGQRVLLDTELQTSYGGRDSVAIITGLKVSQLAK